MYRLKLKDTSYTIPKENLVLFVRSLQRAGEVQTIEQAIKYLESKNVTVEEM